MLWFKALHLIFMVTWFAGLFYLPRLYVYHAMSDDKISHDRFVIMERKLFWGITTPGGVLTIIFGWLLMYTLGSAYVAASHWLHVKLLLIACMVVYHVHCGVVLKRFKNNTNTKSHVYYRFYNEVPVIFLIGIILLASLKPF